MTLSGRDRILLIAIVAIVAVFGFSHFALSPERHQASSLATQIPAAQTALGQARDRYASARAEVTSLHADAATWAAAQRAVPQASDVPNLLRLLERGAHEADVSFKSISIGAAGGAGATAASATTVDGATEVPVSLEFDGGYQALDRLLARLDDLVAVSGRGVRASGPLVGISNVSLAPDTGGLLVTLGVVIYQHAAASTVLGPDAEGSS